MHAFNVVPAPAGAVSKLQQARAALLGLGLPAKHAEVHKKLSRIQAEERPRTRRAAGASTPEPARAHAFEPRRAGPSASGSSTGAKPSSSRGKQPAWPLADIPAALRLTGNPLKDAETIFKAATRVAQTTQAIAETGLEFVQSGGRASTPALLRKTFERLGSTYIKLGQFIASAPTIFPEEYVTEFQYCLDATEPVPFKEIERILNESFPSGYRQFFSYVDPKPIASASIAQVHAARLRSGEEVVIKVQRPGAEDTLRTDLNFLLVAGSLLELANPELKRVSLTEIISDIQQAVAEETDFLAEAKNVTEFRGFLDRMGFNFAVAPKVYMEATRRKVLTMERLRGVPLTDLESIRKYTSDPEGTLIRAMNVWFASVAYHDFFHADVHAGNLLVLEDGRVGFIDFGIVGRIPPEVWAAIDALVLAIPVEDWTQSPAAPQDLFASIRTLDPEDLGVGRPGGVVDDTKINRLVLDLVRVGDRHGVKFPRSFALLFKQSLYFDRYTRILAPRLDPLTDPRVRRSVADAYGGRPGAGAEVGASYPPRGGPDAGQGPVIDVEARREG
eukprot:tig00020539_g10430.t1